MSDSTHDDPAHDRDLLARLRAGEAAAFEIIYFRYYTRLATFAERIADHAEPAEDIVQDVFLSVWERRASQAIVPPILAYLYAAVRNRALSARRRVSVAIRAMPRVMDAEAARAEDASSADPEQRLDASDLRAAMQAAIRALPERQQLALRLRADDGLDTRTIAHVLQISERTVRELLGKALTKLAIVLEQMDASRRGHPSGEDEDVR